MSATASQMTNRVGTGETERNKAVMRRFVTEYQTGRDEAVADELLADDFVNHAEVPGLPNDRAGVKILFAAFHQAFPDFRAEILDQLAEGDRVATYKTFSGTHRGELFGIPATGREVAWTLIDIVRMRDGKIAEHWNVVDMMTLMLSLGWLRDPHKPSPVEGHGAPEVIR